MRLVRTADPGDITALQDLFRRSSLSNEADRAILTANPDALILEPAPVHQGWTRVAVENGQIVGFATARPSRGALELDDLFVDPDHMRRGIATDLIRDVMATASKHGIARVEVTANAHAHAFYISAGFTETAIVETRFGPAVRMSLDVGIAAPHPDRMRSSGPR